MLDSFLDEWEFEEAKKEALTSLVDDPSLTEDQKQNISDNLLSGKFVPMQYFHFSFHEFGSQPVPLFGRDLKFDFKILDVTGRDIPSDSVAWRRTVTSNGRTESSSYNWLIKVGEDLTLLPDEQLPWSFKITFPNGSEKQYYFDKKGFEVALKK